MKKSIAAIVLTAVFSIMIFGNSAFASEMKNSNFDKSQYKQEKTIENKNIMIKEDKNSKEERCQNYEICKDVSKLLKKNDYKALAKYIKKCDHKMVKSIILQMDKDEFQGIIQIINDNGYGDMTKMMDNMLEKEMTMNK